jgi:hypothetical protein
VGISVWVDGDEERSVRFNAATSDTRGALYTVKVTVTALKEPLGVVKVTVPL